MSTKNNIGEQEIIKEISLNKLMEHINYFNKETPNRIAGGGQDLKAAQYIKREMEKYGLDVELNEFETFNSYPGESELELVAPINKRFESIACLHIEATPLEGIEAELIYVGAGGKEDYIDKDVKNKIVLAEVSYSPATPEKARLAYQHGAVGLILMNWGDSVNNLIPMRGLKAVWGNPTPETWKEIPRLYAVTTTRVDGEYLKDLCLKEKVTVRLKTTSHREWGTVTQPIATLKSNNEHSNPDEFIIVSGHLDAWEPGITDNASGNAVMLELARVLSNYKSSLRRNIKFCFWNGHEIAEAAGSTYYVDSNWSEINKGAVAYLNIDSPGMIDTSYLLINRSPELYKFHGEIEEKILGEQGRHFDLSKIGDQSFFGIGVPSITGRFSHSDEQIKKWNGATFGSWNHTNEDTLDKLDPEKLATECELWLAYTFYLACNPILPHRFTYKAESILSSLKEIINEKSSIYNHLSILISLAEELVDQANWIDNYADKLEISYEENTLEEEKDQLNKSLNKLSRFLTSIIKTATGRYEQDSYGLSDLDQPVPLLAQLKTYEKLPADCNEKRLLFTKLLRAKNQISDGLYYAVEEIKYLKNLVNISINKERKQ